MENNTELIEEKKVETYHYKYEETQGFWAWWFNFKNRYSIVKVPIGLILVVFTISAAVGDLMTMIESIRDNPPFLGVMLFLFFPVIIGISFVGTILWAGLLYIPYLVFEEEKKGWRACLKYLGWLVVAVIVLLALNYIIL